MRDKSIGISDMGFYVPQPRVDIDWLIEERARWDGRLGRHLRRAQTVTGQESFRFPEAWEDPATMAAEAAVDLFERQGFPKSLRHLASGTETGLDHSKPLSAYVEGMLREARFPIPTSLSSVQVQHACAGGTLALMNVGAQLAMGGREQDSGLVLCADVARYETRTTAEVTQGAGAAAILVETDPTLIELDLSTAGYCSRDVDDFFRPIGSAVAQVRGRYSIDCYIDNLEAALVDHGERAGRDPDEILKETDLFVLHAPFRNMPWIAMRALLERRLGLDKRQADDFLVSRGFGSGTDTAARIGNTYTAALYFALASQLTYAQRTLGDEIVGKRILLASYGSGNTMILLAGRIAPSAPEIISRWDLDRTVGSGRAAELTEYTAWTEDRTDHLKDILGARSVPARSFYIARMRDDGYREHGYTEHAIPAGQPEVEPAAVVVGASG